MSIYHGHVTLGGEGGLGILRQKKDKFLAKGQIHGNGPDAYVKTSNVLRSSVQKAMNCSYLPPRLCSPFPGSLGEEAGKACLGTLRADVVGKAGRAGCWREMDSRFQSHGSPLWRESIC